MGWKGFWSVFFRLCNAMITSWKHRDSHLMMFSKDPILRLVLKKGTVATLRLTEDDFYSSKLVAVQVHRMGLHMIGR